MFNSHSLSHDFISTDRESPLLPTVWNTDVNEIPSFKRGPDIAMFETVYKDGESTRRNYTKFLHIYLTVHLQFPRMLSDSKRTRTKKKTEKREKLANTVTQGCREIIKKNNDLPMNQARVANRVKKKNKPTNSLESYQSIFRASTRNKITRKVSTPVLNVKVRDVIGWFVKSSALCLNTKRLQRGRGGEKL